MHAGNLSSFLARFWRIFYRRNGFLAIKFDFTLKFLSLHDTNYKREAFYEIQLYEISFSCRKKAVMQVVDLIEALKSNDVVPSWTSSANMTDADFLAPIRDHDAKAAKQPVQHILDGVIDFLGGTAGKSRAIKVER